MDEFTNIENELNDIIEDDLEETNQEELDTTEPGEETNQEQPANDAPGNDPQMIADMILMGVAELFPMYPSLEKVYTPERCLDLSTKVCAVADKHGVSVIGFLGKYMEEIMLGITCISLVKATYQAIDHDMKVAEQKAQEAETEIDEAA